ncbi:hypothetical protein B0H14DRAFT_3711949 [Mycena olivaceomarginata]|nr:hypothetical protein B0H14DRAFT_3711949 [Mycena olivaceomarginata]
MARRILHSTSAKIWADMSENRGGHDASSVSEEKNDRNEAQQEMRWPGHISKRVGRSLGIHHLCIAGYDLARRKTTHARTGSSRRAPLSRETPPPSSPSQTASIPPFPFPGGVIHSFSLAGCGTAGARIGEECAWWGGHGGTEGVRRREDVDEEDGGPGVGGSEAAGTAPKTKGMCPAQVPQKLGLGRGGRESGHTAPLGGVRTQLALGGGMRDDVVVDEGELRTFVLELIVAGAAPLGRSGFASTFRSRAAA